MKNIRHRYIVALFLGLLLGVGQMFYIQTTMSVPADQAAPGDSRCALILTAEPGPCDRPAGNNSQAITDQRRGFPLTTDGTNGPLEIGYVTPILLANMALYIALSLGTFRLFSFVNSKRK